MHKQRYTVNTGQLLAKSQPHRVTQTPKTNNKVQNYIGYTGLRTESQGPPVASDRYVFGVTGTGQMPFWGRIPTVGENLPDRLHSWLEQLSDKLALHFNSRPYAYEIQLFCIAFKLAVMRNVATEILLAQFNQGNISIALPKHA